WENKNRRTCPSYDVVLPNGSTSRRGQRNPLEQKSWKLLDIGEGSTYLNGCLNSHRWRLYTPILLLNQNLFWKKYGSPSHYLHLRGGMARTDEDRCRWKSVPACPWPARDTALSGSTLPEVDFACLSKRPIQASPTTNLGSVL